jgi:hypothetical protein
MKRKIDHTKRRLLIGVFVLGAIIGGLAFVTQYGANASEYNETDNLRNMQASDTVFFDASKETMSSFSGDVIDYSIPNNNLTLDTNTDSWITPEGYLHINYTAHKNGADNSYTMDGEGGGNSYANGAGTIVFSIRTDSWTRFFNSARIKMYTGGTCVGDATFKEWISKNYADIDKYDEWGKNATLNEDGSLSGDFINFLVQFDQISASNGFQGLKILFTESEQSGVVEFDYIAFTAGSSNYFEYFDYDQDKRQHYFKDDAGNLPLIRTTDSLNVACSGCAGKNFLHNRMMWTAGTTLAGLVNNASTDNQEALQIRYNGLVDTYASLKSNTTVTGKNVLGVTLSGTSDLSDIMYVVLKSNGNEVAKLSLKDDFTKAIDGEVPASVTTTPTSYYDNIDSSLSFNEVSFTFKRSDASTQFVNVSNIFFPNAVKLTVHHKTLSGAEFDSDEVRYYEVGDSYTTSPSTKDDNYAVFRVSGVANGVIQSDTEVTYTYVKRAGVIKVKHIDSEGNELADTISETKQYGDTYEYYPIEDLLPYYTVKVPDNSTGIVSADKFNDASGFMEIVFVYEPRSFNVITFHRRSDGRNEEISERKTESYKYGSEYTTEPATELLEQYNYEVGTGAYEDPASGTVDGQKTVIYYYSKKTFTVTVHHQLEDGTEYAEDEVFTLNYGDHWEAIAKQLGEGWNVRVLNDDPTSGEITGDIVISFVYEKESEDNNTNNTSTDGEIESPQTLDKLANYSISAAIFIVGLFGSIYIMVRRSVR